MVCYLNVHMCDVCPLSLSSYNIEEYRIGSTSCEVFSLCICIRQNICCSDGLLTALDTYNFAVYANPEDNVSVTIEQIEWLSDKEARNDVDLGQYTEQNKTNPTIWVRYNKFEAELIMLRLIHTESRLPLYSI